MNKKNSIAKIWLLFMTLALSNTAYAGLADDLITEVRNLAVGANNRAIEARERAIEARDAAEEIRENVREARLLLTSDISERVVAGVQDIQHAIEDERDGIGNFASNGCTSESDACGTFRTSLIDLLTNLELTSDGLLSLTQAEIDVDFGRLNNFITGARPSILFPVYRAVAPDPDSSAISSMNTNLVSVVGNLSLINLDVCSEIVESRAAYRAAYGVIRGNGLALKLVGAASLAAGETSFDLDAGLHGYAHITLDNNFAKKLGRVYVGLGDGMLSAASAASDKLRYCTILEGHDSIQSSVDALVALDFDIPALESSIASRASQLSVDELGENVNMINSDVTELASSLTDVASQTSVNALTTTVSGLNTSNLDTMVSSRASQASVDGLILSVADLDINNLDVAVSTRSSQDSVNDLGEEIAQQRNSDLRIRIETHLSNSKEPISFFYLPEAYGGSLEDVRKVVSMAMTQNEAAGLSLGKAVEYLDLGDQARTIGAFKDAYRNYGKAYRAVTGS